jgi:crotonobetainyl-CoA:carnitine CoA-transferase CaiB-like acyl-CoA transferase
MKNNKKHNAFENLLILEIGDLIAAPYCTKLFADYGAQVIKLEPPEGDYSRKSGPFPNNIPHQETSGLYLNLNTNKKSMTLNLQNLDGRNLFIKLITKANLLVIDKPPYFLESIGLSFEKLQILNPNLIITSITPFGDHGPYAEYETNDFISFALTNRMSPHGIIDGPPLQYGSDVILYQIATTAAAASMAAIFSISNKQKGDIIKISGMEAQIGNVDTRTVFEQYTQRLLQRGSIDLRYPTGCYPCLDGYIVFGSGEDRFFRRLCHAIGQSNLLDDPEWAIPANRESRQEEFEIYLLEWLLERPKQNVFEICQEYGVMCTPINQISDLFVDPQLKYRKYFVKSNHEIVGDITYTGAPFNLSKLKWRINHSAPRLSQHTKEICTKLINISIKELVLLKSNGAI